MVWTPSKPIKFTAPKVNKKTVKTLKSLGSPRMEHMVDGVRARNTNARRMEAQADLLNAQRLTAKNDFQSDLAKKVAAAEPGVSQQSSADAGPMAKTADSLQQLGAGKPYGGS